MENCFKWIHPSFTDAIKHRPDTNYKHLIFPWNNKLKKFSFSEFTPGFRPQLSLKQAETTIDKLNRSPYYYPKMRRVNRILAISSCMGCMNCIFLPLLLVLLINKTIGSPPFRTLVVYGLIFCLVWCICSSLILYAASKDIKTLERRREDFQAILDRENLSYFHKYGKSWQVGPFGSYLQFNFDKLYFPGQNGQEYKQETPLPMSTQRGIYDSGYQ